MSITSLRDLVMVIFTFLATGVVIYFAVLCYLVFRRVESILDLVRDTLTNIHGTTSFMSEMVVTPTIRALSFVRGAQQTVRLLSKIFGRKGGIKDV